MKGTVLITGANRGIGLEFARQYAQDGWRVFACTRRPDQAPELARLAESAKEVSIRRLDVASEADIDALARELDGEKIDILLNNAGVYGPTPQDFGPIDAEGWMEAFRINALAPFRVTRAFAGHVARSDRRIVALIGTLMASLSDNRSGGDYAYRSSKAAGHMVARSLAADLRGQGITTVILHPGWVRTDMGGAKAPLTPEESVHGLRKVLSAITPGDNGCFFSYDGQQLPW